jgi:hypothetical protein
MQRSTSKLIDCLEARCKNLMLPLWKHPQYPMGMWHRGLYGLDTVTKTIILDPVGNRPWSSRFFYLAILRRMQSAYVVGSTEMRTAGRVWVTTGPSLSRGTLPTTIQQQPLSCCFFLYFSQLPPTPQKKLCLYMASLFTE